MANSADPDEIVRHKPSYLDLYRLQRYLCWSAEMKGLTFSMLGRILADDILKYCSYFFFQKTGFDISFDNTITQNAFLRPHISPLIQ